MSALLHRLGARPWLRDVCAGTVFALAVGIAVLAVAPWGPEGAMARWLGHAVPPAGMHGGGWSWTGPDGRLAPGSGNAPGSGGGPGAHGPGADPTLAPIARPGLRLTFSDEFDRLVLQPEGGPWRTSFDYGVIDAYTLTSNGEKQLYVDPTFRGSGDRPLGLNPFRVQDGVLTITAAPVPPDLAARMWGYGYASGLLTTKGRFAQQYGYFEIRARLAQGKGLWPAFWLLPISGRWPPEIDVLEQLGREPQTVYMSTVSKTVPDKPAVYTHAVGTVPDAATAFHRYGMRWSPETIAFFIDGTEIGRVPTPADMHQPMYLLVNLAVGGPWAHDPDPAQPVRGDYAIDYVRAYADAQGSAPAETTRSPAP